MHMDCVSDIPDTPFFDIFETNEEICKRGRCLFQGDIIRLVKGETDFFIERYPDVLGYLIISNSCDLDRLEKMERISMVPIFPFKKLLDEFLDKRIEKLKNTKELENEVTNMIYNESNYKTKFTFFISELKEFSDKPTIAYLDDVRSVEIKSIDMLLKNRITSLKGPWREKLGHKVGYIFNRVATNTPDKEKIKAWWITTYNEEYSYSTDKINGRLTSF